MTKLILHLSVIPILFCLILSGCSGSKNQDQATEGKKSSTGQAVDAMKEYKARPMDKARATQQLGEQRTNAIDDALKQK
jgi:uncharacterized protein YceK